MDSPMPQMVSCRARVGLDIVAAMLTIVDCWPCILDAGERVRILAILAHLTAEAFDANSGPLDRRIVFGSFPPTKDEIVTKDVT